MISSNHYHQSSIFNDEIEKIFSHGWLFVGMKSELENHNDFITLDTGNHSIVVQNFKGIVKAFKNICLHRFLKIQTEPSGNRKFFCKYHGWSYNAEGCAVVPPKFGIDPSTDQCLQLERYEVSNCGAFYFVNLDNSPVSLKTYLGEYYEKLEQFTFSVGALIHSETIPHKANWKLLIENVLECYHCRTVHAESFIPMGIGMLEAVNFNFSSKHNDCEYPKKVNEQLTAKSNKLSFLNYRKLQHESYHHIYIYPNLFISSTEGNLFYIGNFIPLAPDATDLHTRLYAPVIDAPADVKINKFLVDAFYETAKQSAINVLLEDKVILEQIQEVVHKIDRAPIFGNEEFRINNFYKYYFEDITAHE